jgi:hypothetical protein
MFFREPVGSRTTELWFDFLFSHPSLPLAIPALSSDASLGLGQRKNYDLYLFKMYYRPDTVPYNRLKIIQFLQPVCEICTIIVPI